MNIWDSTFYNLHRWWFEFLVNNWYVVLDSIDQKYSLSGALAVTENYWAAVERL